MNDFFDKNEEYEDNFSLPLAPLIDTLLVLLIIFIIATPVINNSINVSLPNGLFNEKVNSKNLIIFAMDQYGKIYDKTKKLISLKSAIEITKKEIEVKSVKNCVIFVDKDAFCGNLIELIDALKNVGVYNVYFKTKKIYI